MHVENVEFSPFRFVGNSCRSNLRLVLRTGSIYCKCSVIVMNRSDDHQLRADLLREALRQVTKMPEILEGHANLTMSPQVCALSMAMQRSA